MITAVGRPRWVIWIDLEEHMSNEMHMNLERTYSCGSTRPRTLYVGLPGEVTEVESDFGWSCCTAAGCCCCGEGVRRGGSSVRDNVGRHCGGERNRFVVTVLRERVSWGEVFKAGCVKLESR